MFENSGGGENEPGRKFRIKVSQEIVQICQSLPRNDVRSHKLSPNDLVISRMLAFATQQFTCRALRLQILDSSWPAWTNLSYCLVMVAVWNDFRIDHTKSSFSPIILFFRGFTAFDPDFVHPKKRMGASRAHVTLALLSVFVLAVVDGVPSISHRSNNVRNAADKLQITPHWLSLRRESPQTSLNRKCCRRSLDWLESVIRVSFLCVTVGNWFLHVFAEQRGDLAKYERNGGQSRNFEEIYSMWTQPKPKPKPEPEPEPEPVELFYFTSQGSTHTENLSYVTITLFLRTEFYRQIYKIITQHTVD